MKSKAKPAKGSARTKRFDVGGTVGALAGLGTLAYLMSRKKKGADGAESGGMSKDPNAPSVMDRLKNKADTTTDTTTDNKSVVKPPPGVIFEEDRQREDARQRALKQSKGKGELVPEGADRKELYSDVNARRTDIAPVVKKKKDASAYTGQGMAGSDKGGKKKAGADNAPAYTGQGMAGSDKGDKGFGTVTKLDDNSPQAKAIKAQRDERTRQKFLESQAGMRRTGIATPGKDKNRQERSKGRSANPIQETIDNAGRSTVRSDKDKMGERAREVQRRREEEMKSRYKKGGAVKKYANGGSVMASKMGSVKTAKPSMRSASSRADGIAQRGKTRA